MRWFWALSLLALTACPSGEPPAPSCLEPLSLECSPLYPAEFDQVFSQTLLPKCGVGNGNCHDATGAKGGLVFRDQAQAYDALIGPGRVLPGDAECSLLVWALAGHGTILEMPPGAPLSAAERCAITQWVASGAEP